MSWTAIAPCLPTVPAARGSPARRTAAHPLLRWPGRTSGSAAPGAHHGAALAALLPGQTERIGAEGMATARVTVELLAPVPLEPMRLSSRVLRAGKRVGLGGGQL